MFKLPNPDIQNLVTKDDTLLWTLPISIILTFVNHWNNDTVIPFILQKSLGLSLSRSTSGSILRCAPNQHLFDGAASSRYPRWGVKTRSSDFGDNRASIVLTTPQPGVSYVLTPGRMLRHLFEDFSMLLPASLEQTADYTDLLDSLRIRFL